VEHLARNDKVAHGLTRLVEQHENVDVRWIDFIMADEEEFLFSQGFDLNVERLLRYSVVRKKIDRLRVSKRNRSLKAALKQSAATKNSPERAAICPSARAFFVFACKGICVVVSILRRRFGMFECPILAVAADEPPRLKI
jgi:hypothetical protein